MKIDEFIEEVNKAAYAKKDGDCIYICDGETTSYQDYYFLAFLVTSKSMDLDWEWRYLRYTDACELRTILNLVKELQDTPVKDRFPEKKYRLVANPNSLEQTGTYATKYVACIQDSMDSFSFVYGGPTIFSEKELKQIENLHPNLAPAIEAMKEDINDDEEQD